MKGDTFKTRETRTTVLCVQVSRWLLLLVLTVGLLFPVMNSLGSHRSQANRAIRAGIWFGQSPALPAGRSP